MFLYSMRPYVIIVCNLKFPWEWFNIHNILNIIEMSKSAYKPVRTYRLCVCVCLEFLSWCSLAIECFVMCLEGKRVRKADWFRWRALPWLVDSAGGIFVCAWIPNSSFSYLFCMVVLVLVYHLLHHIHVCCLTHCGRVTQICVFTLQLYRTGDADLRF